KILAVVLSFMLALSSVGVFAEEISNGEVTQDVTEDTTGDILGDDTIGDDTTGDDTPDDDPIEDDAIMSEEMVALRDAVAERIKDAADDWTAVDMMLYEKIEGTTASMPDETKEEIIAAYIEEATRVDEENPVTVSDRARIEIVLKALGIDSSELYKEGSKKAFDNAKALREADVTSSGHYAAPYILLANLQGNLRLTDEQIETLIELLYANCQSGTFGYEWDGVSYPDYDTASTVITALISMDNENEMAQEMIDAIKNSLRENIAESGSFGSANTDAMVIISWIAMGENPADLKHPESGNSVVDGLLTYVNETNDGFTFWGEENYLATEQAFRALVAMSLYDDEAYNIYDFSANETVHGGEKPKRPSGGGGGSRNEEPEEEKQEEQQEEPQKEPENTDIKEQEKPFAPVEFSDTKGHWGSDAIEYVASRGIMKGVADKSFAPNAKITRAEVIVMLHRLAGEGTVEKEVSFMDVMDDSWFKNAVVWANEMGIAKGSGDGTFGAVDEINREQFIVFAYRFANPSDSEVAYAEEIEDASPWAYDALFWAKNNGIIVGRDNGDLAPQSNITRAEAATIFMRFLELKEI
ncbi:MAG: S-layer homology domain-containing protein, partial [Clostridia bacterium]|nr:S-layer homology domain-containing protein [Clostridia bacterium]